MLGKHPLLLFLLFKTKTIQQTTVMVQLRANSSLGTFPEGRTAQVLRQLDGLATAERAAHCGGRQALETAEKS